ncbi:hypothetical protein [Paenibacillus sp. Leaf72]|uniref:hypothetical protein n=1 Tax=Paenibacillus sp. Leaf72 TaxID=1736234 RepID=UPI0012DD3016|nr:hypothetical protein [Paenibacillus sp. Leaf72]
MLQERLHKIIDRPKIDGIAEFYTNDLNSAMGFEMDLVEHPDLEYYRSNIIPNSFGEISHNVSEDFLEAILEKPIGPSKYDYYER